jgi:hypothetical protein
MKRCVAVMVKLCAGLGEGDGVETYLFDISEGGFHGRNRLPGAVEAKKTKKRRNVP